MFIDIRGIIIHISPAVDVCFFAHTLDKEQAGKNHANLDRYNQVEEYCQDKGSKKYNDITLWSSLDQFYKGTPLAHIICNDKQDCCDCWHWNHSGIWHQYDKYNDQCNGMNDSGNRSTSAVFNICSSSCNSSCRRDSAEKGRSNVAGSLGYKFHVGTVFTVDHSVCDNTGKQRFNRCENSNRKCVRKCILNNFK